MRMLTYGDKTSVELTDHDINDEIELLNDQIQKLANSLWAIKEEMLLNEEHLEKIANKLTKSEVYEEGTNKIIKVVDEK